MSYFLITWNPDRFPWKDREEWIRGVRSKEPYVRSWSVGNRKRISKGDRVFLVRQGVEPRGIIGAGIVREDGSELRDHWPDQKEHHPAKARYAEIQFTGLIDEVDSKEELLLSRDFLQSTEPYDQVNWDTQTSGIWVPDRIGRQIAEEIGL